MNSSTRDHPVLCCLQSTILPVEVRIESADGAKKRSLCLHSCSLNVPVPACQPVLIKLVAKFPLNFLLLPLVNQDAVDRSAHLVLVVAPEVLANKVATGRLDPTDQQGHRARLVHPVLADLTANRDLKVRMEDQANQDWEALMDQKDHAVTLANLDALECLVHRDQRVDPVFLAHLVNAE